jgi:hypothetical protein
MEWQQVAVVVVLTLLAAIVLRCTIALALAGGDVGRLWLTVRTTLRVLRDPLFAEKVRPPPKPVKPSGAPLRLLRLLQRDGRFLDFVLEDVGAFEDAQIAAAVRELQPHWRATLREHLDLEPARAEAERSTVEVPPGFDPSAVQLTGNVTGQPPFRGTLKHPGWRVKEMKVLTPPEGQDEFLLQPAEVELP